ncbi:hypothetical protein MK280_08845, partial [Myxococcota bacterium]|nr:hypothetical protein [Myxococcota bacterium]
MRNQGCSVAALLGAMRSPGGARCRTLDQFPGSLDSLFEAVKQARSGGEETSFAEALGEFGPFEQLQLVVGQPAKKEAGSTPG